MWNGAAEALKPSPTMIIASPVRSSASWLSPPAVTASAIPSKVSFPVAP